MDIINFIFVYIISGFISSAFIKHLTGEKLDNKLSFLLGYGISPLLISLFLYYLYLFFPKEEWGFYVSIIYLIFLAIALFLKKQFVQLISTFKTISISNFLKIFKSYDLNKKILLFFVLFVTIFTLARNIFYHTTYTDAFDYLKQGFIYSYDRSLDRLNAEELFSDFNETNPLYGPEKELAMNKMIRPALPILYSFFYKDNSPNGFIFSSIEFVYSYYFILLIFTVIYILSRFKKNNILIGLTLLLSCYFFVKLSFSDYKEMIISFYALLSLFILYELKENKNWFYAIILGSLCGLMSYINYSGLVISGLIFLLGLLFFKSNLKKKIFTALLILFTFIIFSGNEMLESKKFILEKSFISIKNQEQTFESKEFTNRMAIENKITNKETSSREINEITKKDAGINKFNILLTKKLQAFTQVQVFGLTFWLFLIILILLLIKKIKIDNFSKLNLFFISLFFLVFSDPLFLNPHLYAYVLSLGYRYTSILVPFAVIFIALNYDIFSNVLRKIKINYLQSIILLSILIYSPIRTRLSEKTLSIISRFLELTNPREYYLEKINLFLLILAFFSVIIFIFIFYCKRRIAETELPATINSLFLFVFFMLPFLFILNNNQNIINTFRYSFEKNIPYKMEMATQSSKEKEAFEIIAYINKNIKKNAIIFIDTTQFNSIQYNLWFYIKNNKRLISQKGIEFPEYISFDEFYFLVNKNETFKNCVSEKIFSSTALLKCINSQ